MSAGAEASGSPLPASCLAFSTPRSSPQYACRMQLVHDSHDCKHDYETNRAIHEPTRNGLRYVKIFEPALEPGPRLLFGSIEQVSQPTLELLEPGERQLGLWRFLLQRIKNGFQIIDRCLPTCRRNGLSIARIELLEIGQAVRSESLQFGLREGMPSTSIPPTRAQGRDIGLPVPPAPRRCARRNGRNAQ